MYDSTKLASGHLEIVGPYEFLVVVYNESATGYNEETITDPYSAQDTATDICRRMGWHLISWSMKKEALTVNLVEPKREAKHNARNQRIA